MDFGGPRRAGYKLVPARCRRGRRQRLCQGLQWELGAGSWELGAGSWELGARSWELGAGSWELGAGSWGIAVDTRTHAGSEAEEHLADLLGGCVHRHPEVRGDVSQITRSSN